MSYEWKNDVFLKHARFVLIWCFTYVKSGVYYAYPLMLAWLLCVVLSYQCFFQLYDTGVTSDVQQRADLRFSLFHILAILMFFRKILDFFDNFTGISGNDDKVFKSA